MEKHATCTSVSSRSWHMHVCLLNSSYNLVMMSLQFGTICHSAGVPTLSVLPEGINHWISVRRTTLAKTGMPIELKKLSFLISAKRHLPTVVKDVIVKLRPENIVQSTLFPAFTTSIALSMESLKSLWFIELWSFVVAVLWVCCKAVCFFRVSFQWCRNTTPNKP